MTNLQNYKRDIDEESFNGKDASASDIEMSSYSVSDLSDNQSIEVGPQPMLIKEEL